MLRSWTNGEGVLFSQLECRTNRISKSVAERLAVIFEKSLHAILSACDEV